jgi:hypothetical protein
VAGERQIAGIVGTAMLFGDDMLDVSPFPDKPARVSVHCYCGI